MRRGLGGFNPKKGSPAAIWIKKFIKKSLFPTFGAPPIRRRPPGVNNLGEIKSSGIGVSSFRNSDMVKLGNFGSKLFAVFRKLLISNFSATAS